MQQLTVSVQAATKKHKPRPTPVVQEVPTMSAEEQRREDDALIENFKKVIGRKMKSYFSYSDLCDEFGEPFESSYSSGSYGIGGYATWRLGDHKQIYMLVYFGNHDYVHVVRVNGQMVVAFR